jgi:nucleoid-associated protein YgaU
MPPTEYQVVGGDTLSSLAERFYGESSLFPVISAVNDLAGPDQIDVGQQLMIPYVTFRHQVTATDTKNGLAQQFYNDVGMVEIIEVANHAGQRDLNVGEWLLIPDLADAGPHTVVSGETWEVLADRWYGESSLWPIIMIANNKENQDPPLNQPIIRPGLNWRHTVIAGDTLWQLCTSYYGDTDDDRTKTMVQMVAAANQIEDPDQLPVGKVVFFPSFF